MNAVESDNRLTKTQIPRDRYGERGPGAGRAREPRRTARRPTAGTRDPTAEIGSDAYRLCRVRDVICGLGRSAGPNGQFFDCEITHFTIPPIKNGG